MGYFDEIMFKAAQRASLRFGIFNEGDYYEPFEDYEILHCGKCGAKKEQIMFRATYTIEEINKMMEDYAQKHPDLSYNEVHKAVYSQMPPKRRRIDFGKVGVPCKCQQAVIDGTAKSERDAKRIAKIKENKYDCFPAATLHQDNFAKWGNGNKHLQAAEKYCRKFNEMCESGRGLILCGRAGAGNNRITALFIHTFYRYIGKDKILRKALQCKTLFRCYCSYPEVVFDNRHAVVPCSHIGFKGKRYSVFAFLNTVIRKSIYLIFVCHCGFNLLILCGIFEKIKFIISLYRTVDNIKNMFFQRLFRRKAKTVAHIIVLKCNYICSCSVLRYSVIACIRNEISYIIIPIGKFVVYAIKGFAVIVFGQYRIWKIIYIFYNTVMGILSQ